MAARDLVPSHRPPTLLLLGGGGKRGEEGVIPGFKFHSAVVAGGGMGKGKWGLWEL